MKIYYADLVLHISEFDAESQEDADKVLNEYIDILAKIAEPLRLAWPELHYTVKSVEPDTTACPVCYNQPTNLKG